MQETGRIERTTPACRKPVISAPLAIPIIATALLMLSIGNPPVAAQTEATSEDYTKWELPKGAKERLGKSGINALQFSPNGAHLAVGSNIGIWLYDVKTGNAVSLFPGRCESLAFSPEGRRLANGGSDPDSNLGGSPLENGLEVWELATGRKIPLPEVLPAAQILQFHTDGKTLLSLHKSRYIIGKLDIETGSRKVTTLGKRPGSVHLETYALTQDKIAIGAANGKIEVWDTKTGKKLTTLREYAEPIQVPGRPWEEDNRVLVLVFSPDGTKLASGNLDTTIQLWETHRKDTPISLQKHTGRLTALVFSPDGKMFASGSSDKTVQLWDTVTGEPLHTFTGHLSDVDVLAFSPDGTTLVSASEDGTLLFWNTKTRLPLSTRITGHTGWLDAATFSKESSAIASVAYNGIITLWNLKTFQTTILQTRTTFESTTLDWGWALDFAFSPDGTKLASTGFKYNPQEPPEEVSRTLRVTDVYTGHELMTFPEGGSDMVFSPDGKTVAGSHSNGSIRLWNTETGETTDLPPSDLTDTSESSHRPIVRALAFSSDGKKLVSGTMGGRVQLWDIDTESALTPFFAEQPPVDHRYRDPIMALALSSDGDRIAVGSMKRLRLLGRWKRTRFKEISYSPSVWPTALILPPDDTLLVIGLTNGGIEVWNLATGKRLTTLDGHTDSVQTLTFSADYKTLASASADGTILLWDWDEIRKGSL